MDPIELRCLCGAVRGEADFSHRSRVHVICHCGDCQRWVRHLGRDDANEVVQTAPAFVRITSGMEHVRCARLSERARLRRWYTECCKTPLANTTARAPLSVVLRAAWFLVASIFRGRSRPSPFFDERGAIVKEPIVLSADAS